MNYREYNYPFCTIEPNVGVVAVPDERLDKLAALYSSTAAYLRLLCRQG